MATFLLVGKLFYIHLFSVGDTMQLCVACAWMVTAEPYAVLTT